MRVAVVYDCLFPLSTGGGERVYRRIAELLVERGAEVDYLTRVQWSGAPPDATFSILPVWQGEIYDAAGNRTTSSAVAFAFSVFRELRRGRGKYDMVMASALPVLTLIAARLALAGSGTYLVADWLEVWNGSQWRRYAGVLSGTVASVLQSIGARLGDLRTVNSGFTARRLRRHGRGEVVVLGLVDLVDTAAERGRLADPPYLLFVGRHIPDKRLHTLPAALKVARESIPDLRGIIVGQGAETQRVRDEIVRLDLVNELELVGRVSGERLDELLAGAAVLVNPSAREGFGLVVVEAASHGTPSVVVAGEDNAAADLIADGVNGRLAPSVDPAELGGAIVSTVLAGETLRSSTFEWFGTERVSRGLAASVDEVLRQARTR